LASGLGHRDRTRDFVCDCRDPNFDNAETDHCCSGFSPALATAAFVYYFIGTFMGGYVFLAAGIAAMLGGLLLR